MKNKIIFFITINCIFLMFGCKTNYVIEIHDSLGNNSNDSSVKRILYNNNEIILNNNSECFKTFYNKIINKEYQQALIYGQLYIKQWPDDEMTNRVVDLLVLASLLRINNKKNPNFDAIILNNLYIDETLSLITDLKDNIKNTTISNWEKLLRQGSIHTKPFYVFISGLEKLNSEKKVAFNTLFESISKQNPDWYNNYKINIFKERYSDLLVKRRNQW